jgi:HAD superfamily hydrolase (TIGR01509 family)
MSRTVLRNVIFDVGGVLVDWNPQRILEGFYADPGTRKLLADALFLHPDWRALDRGELSEADLVVSVSERAGRPVAELEALLDAIRASLLPKPATIALLRSLHRQRVPLYCLSNMPVSIYAYLRVRHDFWDLFRGIVISGEVGMLKPEPEIYEYLLARFALQAEDTIFIDDMPQNIEGARASGLRGLRFDDANRTERALREFLHLAVPEAPRLID